MDHASNLVRRVSGPFSLGLLGVALTLIVVTLLAPPAGAQATDRAETDAANQANDLAAQAEGGAKTTTTTAVGAALDDVEGRWEGAIEVAIVIALFVVPMVLGGRLAKWLRMPDYGWKFAIGMGAIAAAAVVVTTGKIRLGPDLSGGIILIYELAEDAESQVARPAAGGAQDEAATGTDEAADGDKADDEPQGDRADMPAATSASRDELVATLIGVLTKRVDPTGTKEVSIRRYGEGQIEIIIPAAEQQELEYIQRRISTSGSLVFRITASERFPEHRQFIRLAHELPPSQDIVRVGDKEVARWVALDQTEFPTIEEANGRGLVTRESPNGSQALVMTNDGLNVTGEYIRMAASDVDETGKPQVSFSFYSQGAFLFGRLTGEHVPTSTGQRYNLGILMDNRLLSAPTIESRITDRGRISGNMSQEEVDFIVGILQAGRLPAALNKTPISKAQISPTLGKQTIEKGQVSLAVSLGLVAIFMAWYYRIAGVIAVVGLAINMLLIVGAMVLIKGAFTLPGLAGLVLTVGMSVDANVLIYERIREELKRGAALKMAIRNGFDRATTTIIDSNVTNLITGVVIYKIAPDNVKGFGITLVLGIAMSIFVAVFLTRIVFDVAERRRLLTTLRMRQFIGETNFDFLGWRRVCIAASTIVIAMGLLAAAARRDDLFDIDFTGGSSVQLVLQDDQKMNFNEVMAVLQKTPLGEAGSNLSLVEVGTTNTRYTVTTVNSDVVAVEKMLSDAFPGKLETYEVNVTDLAPIPAGSALGKFRRGANGWNVLAWPTPFSQVSLLQQSEALDPTSDVPANDSSANVPAQPAEQPIGDATSNSDSTDQAGGASETNVTEDAPTASADDAGPANDGPATESAESAGATPQSAQDSAPSTESSTPPGDAFAGGTTATLKFGTAQQGAPDDALAPSGGVSFSAMEQLLLDALKATGQEGAAYQISNPQYTTQTARNYTQWNVKLALPTEAAAQTLEWIENALDGKPVFPLSNKIGGRVAERMAVDAIAAIILCLAGIIGYVWFRFHGVVYGVAAVVALIHDVLVALGAVALSAFLVDASPAVAQALMIDKFQVSLTLVAAFLTIIGYSLNDTIVIFDRIREIKGKSPRLTGDMINAAVNQCFARTLLTSFTSLISVFVLYLVGGEGIHAFAFALLVGFVAGVYSTIYIANPVLLWLSQRFEAAPTRVPMKAA
jgi:SecD/SecF fusion protein